MKTIKEKITWTLGLVVLLGVFALAGCAGGTTSSDVCLLDLNSGTGGCVNATNNDGNF